MAYTQIEYDFNTSPYAYSNKQEEAKYNSFLDQFRQFDSETTIILKRKEGFNTIDIFRQLRTFQEQEVHNISGVEKITCLQTLQLPEKNAFGVFYNDALPLNDSLFTIKFNRLKDYPDVRKKFLSEDNQFLCFYVKDDSSTAHFSEDLNAALLALTFIDQ